MNQLELELDVESSIKSLLSRAEYQENLAAMHSNSARELRRRAMILCPHDNIDHEFEYYDDEYGSSCPSWTEINVTCSCCGKKAFMNRDKFNKLNVGLDYILNLKEIK